MRLLPAEHQIWESQDHRIASGTGPNRRSTGLSLQKQEINPHQLYPQGGSRGPYKNNDLWVYRYRGGCCSHGFAHKDAWHRQVLIPLKPVD